MVDTTPEKGKIPSAHDVDIAHRNSDLNKRSESQHHTLGRYSYQASPGNHNHDGTTSSALFSGIVITGSRSTNTADVLHQVITALTALGLGDGTGA